MEKLAFALVTMAHELKPYFQAHTIIILTDKPLRRAMTNSEIFKRVALWEIELWALKDRWAIELSEFDM